MDGASLISVSLCRNIPTAVLSAFVPGADAGRWLRDAGPIKDDGAAAKNS